MTVLANRRMRSSHPVVWTLALAAALWLGLPNAAAGAQLFRYENDDGVVVLSSTIPPRYATRGYTVLDARGRVVRVVPRQLSAAEARQRQQELAQEAARREAEEARYRRDLELLRLYKSPTDVERARDRRIESIESAIATTETNIQRLRTQQRNLESRAADAERAGVTVRPELLENLRIIEGQIEERQAEIASRREEIAEITAAYAADAERLRHLMGEADPLAADGEGSARGDAG